MLSFLKEQWNGIPSGQKFSDAVDKSASGDEQQNEKQDYITVESKSDKVRKSTTVLIILFVAGGLFLLFMIKKSVPDSVSAASVSKEEVEIEKAIAQLTGIKSEIFDRMDKIVDKFYEFSNVQQVEVNQLRKNPFNSSVYLLGLDNNGDSDGSEVDLLELQRRQIKQESKDLELLSIMRSSGKSCCIINSKVLYEGDSIKSFRVNQIGDNFVKLQWISKDGEANSEADLEEYGILLKLTE